MVKRNDAPLRSIYIDVLKGIGIILVILGHLIPRGSLWDLIYGVHMPLFLFCSGMFEKDRLHWARLKKIIIYYVAMATICSGIYWLTQCPGDLTYIKQTVFNVLIGGPSPRNGIWPVEALWFLPSLILMTLFYHATLRIPSTAVRHLLILVAVAAGVFLSRYRGVWTMYLSIDVCLLLLPFFYSGSFLKSTVTAMARMKTSRIVLIAALSGAAYIPLALLNGEINIYRGIWGQSIIIYYLEAMVGIAALLASSILIERHILITSTALSTLGKHTLIMMGTHQLFIFFLRPLISSKILLLLVTISISWSISLGISMLTRSLHKRSVSKL